VACSDAIGRVKLPPRGDIAICTVLRQEEPYLQEWLAYHILVGFNRFYLYDNSQYVEPRLWTTAADILSGKRIIATLQWFCIRLCSLASWT
jgi:hypothetical protein